MPAQYPLAGWTPNQPLINYRQLVFGTYVFPLTFQLTSSITKLALQSSRKMPFNPGGDYVPNGTSLTSRELMISGDVGSGLVGSSGNTLVTADDLEAERVQLAALQVYGRQKLWTRPDRYVNAFLSEFDPKFFQDGGAFRYAAWSLKFIADDPRYYSSTPRVVQFNNGSAMTTAGSYYYIYVPSTGSTRTFPVFTFTGACKGPAIGVNDPTQNPSGVGYSTIALQFSKLTMAAGDKLVVSCDPRPESRRVCAIYTPSGGAPVNALKYVAVPSDIYNNKDASLFLPVIEPGIPTFQSFVTTIAGGTTNFTASVTYPDMWL